MKNTMADVRNHLVAMLEALGDDTCTPEIVERAKVTSQVATTFIGAVRCELDALRLHDDIGKLPAAVAPGIDTPRLTAVPGGRQA